HLIYNSKADLNFYTCHRDQSAVKRGVICLYLHCSSADHCLYYTSSSIKNSSSLFKIPWQRQPHPHQRQQQIVLNSMVGEAAVNIRTPWQQWLLRINTLH